MGSPTQITNYALTGVGQLTSQYQKARGATVVLPPVLTAIAPNTGAQAGGDLVYLTGRTFDGVFSVTIGGNAATIISAAGGIIVAKTPLGTGGAKDVVVTGPRGSSTLAGGFTYPASGSAPTLASVLSNVGSWAVGDIDGGYTVTLTGTGFVIGATTVAFGVTAATGVVVSSSTTLTCTVPAHAFGAVSVIVTTAFGSNGANALWTYYSPAQDAETGWWRSFANPTTSTASVGSSGTGGNLAPGVAPTFGTLNGHADAIFDGSTQYLQAASAPSILLGTGAGFIEALISVTSAPAASGLPYTDPQIFSDNGPNVGTCFNSSGFSAYAFDGAYKTTPTPIPLSAGRHHVQMWWDGTNLNARVDSGAPQTVACGAIAGFGSAMFLAKSFGAVFSNIVVEEVLTGSSASTLTQRNNRRAYFATRYGV